jgi:hypothetical protein
MSTLYEDFIFMCEVLNSPDFDSSRMERLLESDDIFECDGVSVRGSKLSSIKRFYKHTNEYNKSKISDLINNNIRNIDKVYNLVLEYENIKHQKGI